LRPANSAPGIMNLFLALYKHRVNCFSILARVWTLRRVFGYGTFKVGTLSCITNRFWSMGCFHIMSIPRWNLETCLSYLYVFPTSVDRNAAGKLIQNLQWPAIDAHIASSALALGDRGTKYRGHLQFIYGTFSTHTDSYPRIIKTQQHCEHDNSLKSRS